MKKHIKWQFLALLLIASVNLGCKDFLDEESIANQTADNYYNTAVGFEDLTRSVYPLLRDITQQRSLVLNGTDLFAANSGWSDAGPTGSPVDLYNVGFSSTLPEISTLWNLLYLELNRANTVISRAEFVEDMNENTKSIRVSEAKFIRALMLFYLVQQWGDVPMPLEETTTANKVVTRVASADVYTQIIKDLTDAESNLPTQSNTEWGRASKGAAQFLLSKVYLTRGWNFNGALGGSAADFNQALAYADKVISDYPMLDNYEDLFPKRSENPLLETNSPSTQNAKNSEVVFAVQFNENRLTNGGDAANPNALVGNDLHSVFGNDPSDTPGAPSGRTGQYNRFLNIHNVTPSVYRLFDPEMDSRYQHNFVEKIYALQDAPDFEARPGVKVAIKTGDVTMEFRPWNNPVKEISDRGLDVDGGTKSYSVLNADEFGDNPKTNYHGINRAMMMWKFWEPGIEYGDGFGTFDFALFRSAEAYLIAAEAKLKGATGGNLASAEVYYNAVLDRALGSKKGQEPQQAAFPEDVSSMSSKSYRATAGTLDIDMILDERAREFMGEYMRWYDLKRTEKLIERVKKHNPWTRVAGGLEAKHLLRPLPLSELDLASNNVEQNPGY
ncbi:RagB/SusD family nutrient uptake outer membrane protein [Marinilongibacter aquaticus]|uniref:RagB/SusD family nutrient uptake outer membrane protein n=1 Tax=Marinilongibacter aquaticus TaxID=2975157 RepID=UPI0021BD740B|nr:RagB/SusD family nutrient uptake outer membrane protein [Marinilongibacter aquaticus]UBM58706.1 RagB/SusD family nutrient uptake outer membrane protein [Marinilongibacter aquaticus]